MSNPSSRRPALFQIPLRLSAGRAVGLIGLCAGLSVGFMLLALTNERGLVLQGVVRLTPGSATIFYSVASAVMGLIVLPGACAIAWKGVWLGQRVAFVEEGLLLPAGFWSADEVMVPYLELSDLALVEIGGERVLTLILPGRRFRIGSSWLPSEQAFDQVLERVRAGSQQGPRSAA